MYRHTSTLLLGKDCKFGTVEVYEMPWVKISSEAHKAMKQYLVDIEGMSLGELAEDAFSFAMEKLEDFEKFVDLEETEEDGENKEEQEEEIESEED
jgi:hypothetical protein